MTQTSPAATREAPDALAPALDTPRRVLIVVEPTALGAHTARVGVALAADLQAEAVVHMAFPVKRTGAESAGELVDALDAYQRQCTERAEPVFAAARRAAAARELPCDTVLTLDREPVDAALHLAHERACGLIVAGSRAAQGVTRLLGSDLGDELLHRAACPVVVCREDSVYADVAPTPEPE